MAKMLITKEQYHSMSPMGVELHDYWMKWKPEMYKEMAEAGTLWKVLQSEDNRLFDMVCQMMQDGMSEDMAKEVARAEIYDPTEDETDEIEETEEDRRRQEMYDLFVEMRRTLEAEQRALDEEKYLL